MKTKLKIKTGDTVRIMTGRDKGKEGKVTQVFPARGLVVVAGVNERTKHLKKRGTQAGQRVNFSAPLQASNVQVVGSNGVGRVSRVSKKIDGKNKNVRVLKTKKGTEELA